MKFRTTKKMFESEKSRMYILMHEMRKCMLDNGKEDEWI